MCDTFIKPARKHTHIGKSGFRPSPTAFGGVPWGRERKEGRQAAGMFTCTSLNMCVLVESFTQNSYQSPAL